MEWLYLVWGYALLSAAVFKADDFLLHITNVVLFSAGATMVTVQILTHLGVY